MTDETDTEMKKIQLETAKLELEAKRLDLRNNDLPIALSNPETVAHQAKERLPLSGPLLPASKYARSSPGPKPRASATFRRSSQRTPLSNFGIWHPADRTICWLRGLNTPAPFGSHAWWGRPIP
jgi:hypothetical protein